MLIAIFFLMAFFLVWVALKYDRLTDWEETAEPSPDFRAMHKRETQLLMIQEVLNQAQTEGKLSHEMVDEFDRFCEKEIATMRRAETDWKDRHRPKPSA